MILLMGGLKRGGPKEWESIRQLQEKTNAKIYVSNYENWGSAPFDYEFFTTPKNNNLNIFNDPNSWYECKNKYPRYYYQWEHLLNCYTQIKKSLNSDDIIYKIRNDFFYKDFPIILPKENTVHVPKKEYHAALEFDIKTVCNDQIVCMKKDVADIYFELPYYQPKDPNIAINHRKGKIPLKEIGIEGVLNKYLKDNNIKIETFDFRY